MRTVAILSTLVLASAASLIAAAPQTAAKAPAAAAPAAGAQTFDVDGVHSKALFRVHHLNAGQFWGRFNDVSGTFTVNEGKPEGVSFDISIKVDSVDTGNEKLDAHLKSPDFFNSKENPTLAFKSTGVKKGPKDGWLEVTGDLTMNGVTKPVTAMVEFTGSAEGPQGRKAGYEAIFSVKRSDWNIKYGVDQKMLGDDVRIIVALEGNLKK
jgi:polyisoprenoid-binding protein YceI